MKSFNPPFESYQNRLYSKSLIQILESYINQVESLKSKNESIHIRAVKNICQRINKTVNLYLSGNSGEAYSTLTTLLDDKEIGSAIIDISAVDKKSIILYKARVGNKILSKRTEIFHLPFDQRHLVKNYRYSIPGVPSLYLGTSTYICWIELHQPSFSDFWISKYLFNPKDNIVIDFTFSIEDKIRVFNDSTINVSTLNNYLKVWPLVIACSFKTKFPNSNFHEEYVIPNIILQWIKRDRPTIIGLKFVSTKTPIRDSKICNNYVFPSMPKNIPEPSKYCDYLKSYFRLTYPLPWSMLDTLPKPDVIATGDNSFKSKNVQEVIIENYELTEFRMIERLIDNFEIRQIPIYKNLT